MQLLGGVWAMCNLCFFWFYVSFIYVLFILYMSIRYLLWVLKLSTWVLKYSSSKPKLNCIRKNLGGIQGACMLYKHRSMQPEPKCLNIGVLTLNLLYCYLNTIFVLPGLGTGQGMSTQMIDLKIYENLHKLT